jgi:hypothetical protein
MTYNGTAYVGINVDTRAIPDPGVFLECIRAAFDEVLAIADPDAGAVLGLHSGAPVAEPGVAAPATRTPARKRAPAKKAAATRKATPAKKAAVSKKAPVTKGTAAATTSS